MIKTQIGIGVLSIPAAFDTLGFVPGIVTLIAVALITTWVCTDRRWVSQSSGFLANAVASLTTLLAALSCAT